MFRKFKRAILEQLREAARNLPSETEPVLTSRVDLRVPEARWGDLSTNAPLAWARSLGQSPRDIAGVLAESLETNPYVDEVHVAGPGFMNLHLNREAWIRHWMERRGEPDFGIIDVHRVIVEHTSVNPNKAAHVGHLRNAVLGDTLVRAWRFFGVPVHVQNYIDDTGIQVADVVIAFYDMEGIRDPEALDQVPEPFDYYCWDLYTRVQAWFEADPERTGRRHEVLRALESGEGVLAEFGRRISRRISRAHLRTMERLGIRYDLLPRESTILELKFWDEAFERLKAAGAIIYVTEGKNAGCWVLPLRGRPEWDHLEDPDKVLVRSNGTVTYVAKDIAYQMWKLGLLERDFGYEVFYRYDDGQAVWTTTADTERRADVTFGGGADRVYNVIDVRQAYLQNIVVEAVRRLGYEEAAEHSIHFSYEMVALAADTARKLGIQVDEGNKIVAFSGRRGIGVKADELMDAMEEHAYRELRERYPGGDEADLRNRARAIMQAALRYFLLRFTRNTVIAFDMDEAMRMDGETGVYIQYAWVRARNIFDRLGVWPSYWEWLAERADQFPGRDYWKSDEGQESWQLIYRASQIDDVVFRAIDTLELNQLTAFLYEYAQAFHRYYLKYRVAGEADLQKQYARALTVAAVVETLRRLMGVLGLPLIDRM